MAETPVTVFLDASSGEPILPEARDAWLAAQQAGWGDPERLHRPGRLAAQALDRSREVVAGAVGARPDEIIFPASGPHAVQAAIAGLAKGRARIGRTVVTSTIDHSAALSAADAIGPARHVSVDRLGRLDLSGWKAAVRADGVALACLQVANHEVGTLQPYVEAAETCRSAGVPLVLDATAALGRIDLARARGVVGPGRLGGCLRRADLGGPAGAAPLGAVAGAVSSRRLPGRAMAGSARRAGDLRRSGRPGGLVGGRATPSPGGSSR